MWHVKNMLDWYAFFGVWWCLHTCWKLTSYLSRDGHFLTHYLPNDCTRLHLQAYSNPVEISAHVTGFYLGFYFSEMTCYGMSHNPSCLFQCPYRTTLFSSYSVWMLDGFNATRFSLSNMIVQLLSHIFPSEMSEDDFNSGRTVASVASLESWLDCSFPFCEGLSMYLSGKVTDGLLYGLISDRNWISSSPQYFFDAALSPFAIIACSGDALENFH